MEKVSIIIPVYNIEEYIDECLNSICNQTYTNLEIIVVDDGSKDESAKKCDEWSAKDARIVVVHKKNGGQSSARNVGLDLASGKYVYFLDGDDIVEANLIEVLIKNMENGYDMVAFPYKELYLDGTIKNIERDCYGEFLILTEVQKRDFYIEILLQHKIGWAPWDRIYSREIIENFHLRFEESIRFGEDLYFCICYCFHCKNILHIKEYLYRYRQRSESIMGQDGEKLNVGRMNEISKAFFCYIEQYPECKAMLDVYPVIHYLIINSVLSKSVLNKNCDWKEFRRCVLEDIEDKKFFYNHLKQIIRYDGYLERIFKGRFSNKFIKEKISILQYILDGNYLAFYLRNRKIYKINEKE